MTTDFEKLVASALDRWVALDVDNEIEAKEIVELVAGEVLQALRQHAGSDSFAVDEQGRVVRLERAGERTYTGYPEKPVRQTLYVLLPTPQEQES